MARAKARAEQPARGPANPGAPDAPALPPWKAFVVQFSRETRAGGGAFAGRVEHLHSGRRARFKSPEDLLAVLEKLLGQLHEEEP